MIETLEQYYKNKEKIISQVDDRGVLSPSQLAAIIDVPIKSVREVEELENTKEFRYLDNLHVNNSLSFFDCFKVQRYPSLTEMYDYGVSNLLFIFYHRTNMNYFFIMDNGKIFRVMVSSLGFSKGSETITNSLLSVFEKLKIEELKDRESWLAVEDRFDILDL